MDHADTVIRGIEEFNKTDVTSIMIHYPPYYGVQKTMDMLRFFAKEVLAHIRNK